MPDNTIINVAVHDLKRVSDTFQIALRNSDLGVTDPVQRLVDQLHLLYGRRTSKSHGEFADDDKNYPTRGNLKNYLADQQSGFSVLTEELMKTLQKSAQGKGGVTGGHVFFAHFERDGRHYLLVAIVNDRLNSALTNQNKVVDLTNLDVDGFRFAGRINITAWENNELRYIGFLKGRGNVAEYFQEFLGCASSVQEKIDTRGLVDALKGFADTQTMDQKARNDFLMRAKNICDRVAIKREEISFEALANELTPANPEPLKDYLANPDLKLNDGFIPNRRMLGSLVRFKAKTSTWSVEFDRDAITSGEVVYDSEKQTITLRNLPQELQVELNSEIANED